MNAPTVRELLDSDVVIAALEAAWIDSRYEDGQNRDEEGGWIYIHVITGTLQAVRAASGGTASIDLNCPPLLDDCMIIATFHTHPNPSSEGWYSGPSVDDARWAWALGVPWIIRADDGVYSTGPEGRRGGLTGGALFPPTMT